MKSLRPIVLTVAAVLLCGCAAPAPAAGAPVPALEESVPTDMPTAEPAPDGAALLALGEYRGAIDAFVAASEQDPVSVPRVREIIDACLAAETAQAGDFSAELIAAYEKLSRMDAATEEDVLALAARYDSAGRAYDRCVLLETSQLLSPTEQKQSLLDALIIRDAPGEAGQTLTALSDALSGGDTDAACALVLDPAAFETLISGIPSTTRRYRADGGEGSVLRAELLSTLPGRERFSVWYLTAGGQVTYLCRNAQTFLRVTAGYGNETYNGAFSALFLDGATGTVYTDAGTLTNGLWTGGLAATVAAGQGAVSVQQLWATRDAIPPVAYTGVFDDAGHPTAKQQNNADGVVYAYTDDGKAYLTLTGAEAGAAFGADALSLPPLPVW